MNNQQITQTEKILKPVPLAPLQIHPLVSVIIANYNYAQFVGKAIESVLNQTNQKFEIVICDDGSSDDSCKVIESYIRHDPRINLIRQENEGPASALNAAYAASNGQIVCLLDSDDAFESSKIEDVVSAFGKNPRAGFSIHRLQPVSAIDKNLGSPVPIELERGWIAMKALRAGGSAFGIPTASGNSFRREVTDLIFPIPSHLKRMCDNYLWRTAIFLTEVWAIPETLGKYRLHGENLTGMLTVSASGILRNVEDRRPVVEAQRQFVAQRFGKNIGDRIRLEDSLYWESLMAAYLLSPEQKTVLTHTPDEMLAHIPRGLRKNLWQLLLIVPRIMGKHALRIWWTPARWQGYVRLFLRMLRCCWRILPS